MATIADRMRVGLVLGSDRPGWVDRARHAEELGFRYLATGEHIRVDRGHRR